MIIRIYTASYVHAVDDYIVICGAQSLMTLLQVTAVKEAAGTGNKRTKSRVTGVNVFLLKQFTPGSKVPKNNERGELKRERNKIVYISRNDDSMRVEEKIKSAFGLHVCNKYTVLESDSKGCNLFVSPLQYLNGNQAIRRRKALYLCEVSKFCSYIALIIAI